MTIRPTARGYGLLAGAAALWWLSSLAGAAVLAAAAALLAAAAGSGLGWIVLRLRGIQAAADPPPAVVACGDTARVRVRIGVRFADGAPVAVLGGIVQGCAGTWPTVRLAAPATVLQGSARLAQRGRFHWPAVELLLADPLGLWQGRLEVAAGGGTTVVPPVVPLVGGSAAGQGFGPEPGEPANRSAGGRQEQVGSIPREYRAGDDMRRMHWPATARTGEPMVRADDEDDSGHVLIVLDTLADSYPDREHGFSPRFERGLVACASVAAHLLGQGVRLDVRTAGGRPLGGRRGTAGGPDLPGLLLDLAELQPEDRQPALAWPGPVGLVVAGTPASPVLTAGSTGWGRGPAALLLDRSASTGAPGPAGPGALGDVGVWDGTGSLAGAWAALNRGPARAWPSGAGDPR